MISSILKILIQFLLVSNILVLSVSAATSFKPYIAWMADPISANFVLTWDMWWGENGSIVKLEENGTIISTTSVIANSPQAQHGEFNLTNKSSGNYSYRVLLCNEITCTASDTKLIHVTLASSTSSTNNTTSSIA